LINASVDASGDLAWVTGAAAGAISIVPVPVPVPVLRNRKVEVADTGICDAAQWNEKTHKEMSNRNDNAGCRLRALYIPYT
jgi:hypothetical protein